MEYYKYHALGNDYLVLSGRTRPLPNAAQLRRICHRHYGVGSDGILLDVEAPVGADFCLRIINPDGSEAEKSGNGLRIFARYLYDQRRVAEQPFSIATAGGTVRAQVSDGGARVRVEMGRVSFPAADAGREIRRERLDLTHHGEARQFEYCTASVGNPHCVVLCERLPDAEFVCRWGALIETQPRFPNRTNVQFMTPLDRQRIAIEIWERGAGYTLASGTSSTAAAAVAHRLGWCDAAVSVVMPGGELELAFSDDLCRRNDRPGNPCRARRDRPGSVYRPGALVADATDHSWHRICLSR